MRKKSLDAEPISTSNNQGSNDSSREDDALILHKSDGKRIAQALEMPELDIELDRAVWQVERALTAEKELRKEKADLAEANAKPTEPTEK